MRFALSATAGGPISTGCLGFDSERYSAYHFIRAGDSVTRFKGGNDYGRAKNPRSLF